jgi:acetate kinase
VGIEMRVLVINCGSSTLKFQVVDVDSQGGDFRADRQLIDGTLDRIGHAGSVRIRKEGGPELQEEVSAGDHAGGMDLVLEKLESLGYLGPGGVQAVGHRVVQGGRLFTRPTLIDNGVMDDIQSLNHLAPLHNGPSVEAIRAAYRRLGTDIPMVATFDTLFHRSLPPHAAQYPIPAELAEKHQVQRYGAHGLAHRYMTLRYAQLTDRPMAAVDLITLQLGSGCSAAAVRGGRSVDTSMGLTPLEGLMMGTRTGDVDPSLAGYLARSEGVSAEAVEEWFNRRSGLLGVSGVSQDVRDLLEAEGQGNARAALALDMFCYRVRKYIGAYLAALGRADAVIFGGGIGENSPEIRRRICAGLEGLGITLDPRRNDEAKGTEGRIGIEDSQVQSYVIPVDEAAVIARDTVDCVGEGGG